ncbi:MAG: iron-containing alcohol dehydrogenase [Oscillospiraceae bacterium]|nr:iron-containing alcohol dehydrogenase [Oscillospiraceae bacterium]
MEFYLPVRLLTGRGVVAQNASRLKAFGRRCLIVTGGSAAKRCGALEDVTAALASLDIAYTVFDEVRPNPSVFTCVEGGQRAHAFGADFVLGIGGGSALDAAKLIAVSAANPELDAAGLYRKDWANKPLPVVLVGTTAGTGSEVTPVAVITDASGRKNSFHGEDMYAALSFGDPRYTESMPLSVTASTGVDALAHCLESLLSRTTTDVSRAFALQGVTQLLAPLQTVASGSLPSAAEREILYNGSILGGMAISVTGTVFPHKLGYWLTEEHGIPHGFACAVFLPALLRHAESCDASELQSLLRRCGTDRESLTALIEALTPKPGVSLTEAELKALLPRWENNAALRKTVGGVSTVELREILRELFA